MRSADVRKLLKRHAELTKWKRQAARYHEVYGDLGSMETRAKHAMRCAEADRELPGIEKELRSAWEVVK